MSVAGADSILVERCSFSGGGIGIYVYEDSSGKIKGCDFRDIVVSVLAINNSTEMEISDCHLGGGAIRTLDIADRSPAYGSRNTLGGGSYATIVSFASAEFFDCDIQPGGEYTVYFGATVAPLPTMDLRSNYWFTTDAETIAAGIHDGNDEPGLGIVQFEPFLMQSVPTETTSFGELKARYGGQ